MCRGSIGSSAHSFLSNVAVSWAFSSMGALSAALADALAEELAVGSSAFSLLLLSAAFHTRLAALLGGLADVSS